MLVSFDENGFPFLAWEIPPDHAAIFSIVSLEDRWHLVFARRDQVSTRTTLEFSYQHVAAHTHDALRAIGSTILDTANGESVMLRNPQLPCASVAVVTRDTLTENNGRVQKEVPQQLSFLVNDVVTWLVKHGHLRKVERPPIELVVMQQSHKARERLQNACEPIPSCIIPRTAR